MAARAFLKTKDVLPTYGNAMHLLLSFLLFWSLTFVVSLLSKNLFTQL